MISKSVLPPVTPHLNGFRTLAAFTDVSIRAIHEVHKASQGFVLTSETFTLFQGVQRDFVTSDPALIVQGGTQKTHMFRARQRANICSVDWRVIKMMLTTTSSKNVDGEV